MNEIKETEPRLNVIRGLKYAAISGLLGFIAVIIGDFFLLPVIDSISYGEGIRFHIYTIDNFYDWLTEGWMSYPAIHGVTAIPFILAGTGWATYAPRGKFSFALSLVKLCLIAFVLMFFIILVVFLMGLESRTKGDQPILYLSEILVLVMSPVGASIILSLFRAYRSPPAEASEEMKTGNSSFGKA